jgi:phosphate transport system protein
MERHFDRELERLRKTISQLGEAVAVAIGEALHALVDGDAALARRVIAADEVIDQLELEVDRISTDIIALQQPAARDLRFVITALKIAPELERIGDLAGNIAERAIELCGEPQLKPLIDIPRMANIAARMVRDSLEAFLTGDAAAAREVYRRDDEVDGLMEQLFRELLSYMMEDPRTISRALRLMMIAKYLERIGDGATNICELVVYLAEGQVIRHGGFPPDKGSTG